MYRHNRIYQSERPLIELRTVSKRFATHHGQQRSLQERFIRLFTGQKDAPQERYFWPLRDISLTVQAGDSIGIIGPNGSGKSTLLKMVTGIIEPTGGEIYVNGPLSSLLELGAGFHPDLSGRENIYLNASIYGMSTRQIDERLESIVDFAELHQFIDTPVKHYSSGMYVRLGFAVAIHTDPKLLLVDEVLAVGDAHFQAKCMDAIQHFRDGGGTLLLVSHDLGSIATICNRALWFEQGEIRADGTPTDVIMQYKNFQAERENQGSAQATTLPDGGKRWGSGAVRITNVELRDAEGNPRTTFFTDGALEVHIEYEAPERIDDIVFGLAIHHQSGAHLTGPNTKIGNLEIPLVYGKGSLIYRVPTLPLLEGTYLLSLAALNHSGSTMYDYHDRAYLFRVYPGESREEYGYITLNGEWQLSRPIEGESSAKQQHASHTEKSATTATTVPDESHRVQSL